MAETSGFWNYVDIETAPEYPAQMFADYFADFLTNGVYAKDDAMGLKVTVSGMTATVAAGTAFMRGYRYHNDGAPALTFTISTAPTVAGVDRIDRLVLRLDVTSEKIEAALKQGTESSSPQVPALTNSSSILEIPLAQIRVKANASTGTVTDERVPVSSLIEIPYMDMKAENQAVFNAWMSQVQATLNESTAGNLLGLINTNTADITVLQTDKMENSRIKLSATDAVLNQMQDGDVWIKYE